MPSTPTTSLPAPPRGAYSPARLAARGCSALSRGGASHVPRALRAHQTAVRAAGTAAAAPDAVARIVALVQTCAEEDPLGRSALELCHAAMGALLSAPSKGPAPVEEVDEEVEDDDDWDDLGDEEDEEVEMDEDVLYVQSLAGRPAPLVDAAREGRPGPVRLLLRAGAGGDCDAADVLGKTPLHWAAQSGHAEVARLLLGGGASAEGRARDGWAPLHCAAWGGHLGVARLLLDEGGADCAAADNARRTPLHLAAQNGHAALAQALVARGGGPGAPDLAGKTPLFRAAQNGHAEVVRLLLAAGASADDCLRAAALRGHEAVVGLLLGAGRGVEAQAALIAAARNGHERVVQLLLAAGVDASQAGPDGKTALDVARERGHAVVVSLL